MDFSNPVYLIVAAVVGGIVKHFWPALAALLASLSSKPTPSPAPTPTPDAPAKPNEPTPTIPGLDLIQHLIVPLLRRLFGGGGVKMMAAGEPLPPEDKAAVAVLAQAIKSDPATHREVFALIGSPPAA